MTRIVLADDHPIVRQGLHGLLEKEPGFSVVGETADGLKVADLVEETKADVLVLDLLMPGLGGLDVTREVARRSPKTRSARVTPRRNGVPVGPDYRMLMSGRFDGGDGAMQHVQADTRTPG